MNVRAVTFDCAETLLSYHWRPGPTVVACAEELGYRLEPTAAERFEAGMQARWADYRLINLARDLARADRFWLGIVEDWAMGEGLPRESVPSIQARAEAMVYGHPSVAFSLFDDVRPCLAALADCGVRMGVVSNWDTNLSRALALFGLDSSFEFMLASMEEGFEKPDSRLFELALDRLGLPPDQVLHVGDNPVDDLAGALGVGMGALLVDRSGQSGSPDSIGSLTELPARICRCA